MSVWDLCFWYHSNEGKEIVGIAEVTKESFPDPTIDDPKRVATIIKPLQWLKKSVTLQQIKSDPILSNITLLKQPRLSVISIKKEEFDYIIFLSMQ